VDEVLTSNFHPKLWTPITLGRKIGLGRVLPFWKEYKVSYPSEPRKSKLNHLNLVLIE
jgi:hypothetical protein